MSRARRRPPSNASGRAATPAAPRTSSPAQQIPASPLFVSDAASRAATSLYVVVALTLLVAGWSPHPRTWGVDTLGYAPRGLWIASAVLLASMVWPKAAFRAAGIVLRTATTIVRSWRWTLLVAVVAGVVFYVLRLRFQVLGDGIVWLEKIERRERFNNFEPLATTLVMFFARQFHEPRAAAGLPSVGLGVIFVVASARLCRALWPASVAAGLAWCGWIVHPIVLLYFGYVESYPLLIVMQVLVVLALVLHLQRGLAVAWPIAVFALAIGTHILALAWLPALLAATLRPAGSSPPTTRRWRALLIGMGWCALAVGAAVLLVRLTGRSPLDLVRKTSGETGLGGLWRTQHLAGRVSDLANEFLLVATPLVVLGVLPGTWGACRRACREAPWHLLLWMLPGPLLFWLLIPARIGAARDWDLYLTMLLPALLLVVEGWRRVAEVEAPPARRTTAHLQVGRVFALATVVTVAWLWVHVDPTRAAHRLLVLQDRNGTFSNFARGYANETLGIWWRDRDPRAGRDAYARATEANGANARYFNNLANCELRLQNLPAARDGFRRAYELGMREWFLLQNLGVAELQLHNPQAAESVFVDLVQRWPDRWLGHACLAQTRIELNQADSALAELEQARTLAPREPDVYYFQGLALRDLGRTAEARAALLQALQLSPKHDLAQQALAALDAGRTPPGPDGGPAPRPVK